jgi:hypothetical protein
MQVHLRASDVAELSAFRHDVRENRLLDRTSGTPIFEFGGCCSIDDSAEPPDPPIGVTIWIFPERG